MFDPTGAILLIFAFAIGGCLIAGGIATLHAAHRGNYQRAFRRQAAARRARNAR